MKIRLIFLIIISTIIVSCKTNRSLTGKYRSNFPDAGFFNTEIHFNSDSAFIYEFSGDLTHDILLGEYCIIDKIVYLKFNKLKRNFGNEIYTDSIPDIIQYQNTHDYELKQEKNIQYHLKYKIAGNKLFVFHIKTGMIVKKSEYYTGSRKFIFFGSKKTAKKHYLKKQN